MRDARAHHAGTEDADLAISLHRNRAGSPDQLIGVADRVEQRADHVLRLRRNRQTRELPVLYLQPGIDVDMASVIDAFHDRRGRRIKARSLAAYGSGSAHEQLP